MTLLDLCGSFPQCLPLMSTPVCFPMAWTVKTFSPPEVTAWNTWGEVRSHERFSTVFPFKKNSPSADAKRRHSLYLHTWPSPGLERLQLPLRIFGSLISQSFSSVFCWVANVSPICHNFLHASTVKSARTRTTKQTRKKVTFLILLWLQFNSIYLFEEHLIQ